MALCDGNGYPLAIHIESATPHESQLIKETLECYFIEKLPAKIIGDKAHDCKQLDAHLRETRVIEMIAPNRRGTRRTQDGRPLSRYRKRWKIERLFSWI